ERGAAVGGARDDDIAHVAGENLAPGDVEGAVGPARERRTAARTRIPIDDDALAERAAAVGGASDADLRTERRGLSAVMMLRRSRGSAPLPFALPFCTAAVDPRSEHNALSVHHQVVERVTRRRPALVVVDRERRLKRASTIDRAREAQVARREAATGDRY